MAEKTIKDKLVTVAGIIPQVYEAGIEEGKVRERDAFWSALTQDGARTEWQNSGVFAGYSWSFNNFYPTRDIKPVGNASSLFYNWGGGEQYKGSLKQRFEECGVVLDTSGATNLTSLFAYCTDLIEVPTIDLTNAPTSTTVFGYCYYGLEFIEKIIVNENNIYTNWFIFARGLVEIRVEGTIGQDGFDIHWSTKLSRESIESILDALSRSPTVANPTITLSKAAVDKAYETTPGANDGSESYEWLVACQGPESPNAWNIILN